MKVLVHPDFCDIAEEHETSAKQADGESCRAQPAGPAGLSLMEAHQAHDEEPQSRIHEHGPQDRFSTGSTTASESEKHTGCDLQEAAQHSQQAASAAAVCVVHGDLLTIDETHTAVLCVQLLVPGPANAPSEPRAS